MKHVVMLLTNAFRPDLRVLKEARSLVQAGYQVTILCWDRAGELAQAEIVDGIRVERIRTGKTMYSAGSRQIFYLPRFWFKALYRLYNLKPAVIHCHDLDTTPVGYLYGKLTNTPWIFDAHECYPEQIGPQVSPVIYQLLRRLEGLMVRKASHMITVGQLLKGYFEQLGAKKITVVGNYQPLSDYASTTIIKRSQLNIPEGNLLVSYIGGFTLARAIIPMIKATNAASNITFLLGGDGPQRTRIEELLPEHPNVCYLGWIDGAQIPQYVQVADVVYYGLYADSGNSRFSSPNALFAALAAGKPVLTTRLGEIGEIVEREACGITVAQPEPAELVSALEQMQDSEKRATMAKNARRAGETIYNWQAAEAALLQLYKQFS